MRARRSTQQRSPARWLGCTVSSSAPARSCCAASSLAPARRRFSRSPAGSSRRRDWLPSAFRTRSRRSVSWSWPRRCFAHCGSASPKGSPTTRPASSASLVQISHKPVLVVR